MGQKAKQNRRWHRERYIREQEGRLPPPKPAKVRHVVDLFPGGEKCAA